MGPWSKKELYVTTSKGELYTIDCGNEDPEKVVLRVRDHGINCRHSFIPPADIEKIEIRERNYK